MKKEDLCYGQLRNSIVEKPKRGMEEIDHTGMFNFFGVRPSKVKRIRLQCPICGRRIWSSIEQNDGEIYHSLPPHKPKGWWKKKKKVSRDNRRKIRR